MSRTPQSAAHRRLQLRLPGIQIHLLAVLAIGVTCNSMDAGAQAQAVTSDPQIKHDLIGANEALPARDGAAGADTPMPEERLGPDDLVQISVPDCPELTRTFRVQSSGTLSLPLIKEPVAVAGLLPPMAADRIRDALQKESILKDPVVILSVQEYRSRPVSVVGAVNHPLTFQAAGQTTLLDAIARAGGMTSAVGSTILVTGQTADEHGNIKVTVTSIASSNLLSSPNPEANIRLHGGEQIRVLEAGHIFVAGNVRHPGMFAIQSDADMTVVKAIALSEGLQPYAAHTAYIYRQQHPGGQRVEVEVPLNRIMGRKEPDVALLSDDILYVPQNGGKKMTGRVLEQLTGFAQTTASGVLVFH